jgi:sulfite reductase (NADPH) hemoprotein beta-component
MKTKGLDPPRRGTGADRRHFADPAFETGLSDDLDRSDPDFALWVDRNVAPHKQPGYAIVNDQPQAHRRHPRRCERRADRADGRPCRALQLRRAARHPCQNIVLPHVARPTCTRCGRRWRRRPRRPNLDLVTDIIACPGLDYCSLANARSIPVAQKIAQRFAERQGHAEIGELKLKISGCINACGHHHAGHIGILGVDRKGTENYQLLLGGSGAEDCSLGTITGPGFDENGIVDAVEKATDLYLAQRTEGERFLDTYRRLRHGPVQGGDLWLIRLSSRRRLGSQHWRKFAA